MTIRVYGEKAGRTHENQMLQVFLERLEDRWAYSTDWIVAIANAMWNGAEIDLVCILPSAIIVADFKSHGGKLTGTENGPWQADGAIVKGGRKANPYQQLRDNKFFVLDWLQSKALLSGRNLDHISAGVIFSSRIEDHLELPPKVRSWFYRTDLANCAVMLDGLSSPELRIAHDEALEIVRRLGVQPIEWANSRPQVRDIHSRPDQPQARTPLTAHQREALQTLSSFVAEGDSVSLSVLGMTSTGKSRLLAELADEVKKVGKQVIVLQPNRRLAGRAEVESNSIYGHLYTGSVNGDDELENEVEQKELKVIPLRACDDAADCVYLVDDAHLLGDSRFSTPDGKQYGTGHLLSDFFEFAAFDKGARKVVFFGDPYQIQRGGSEGAVLSGDFQKSRELKHQSLELTQLIDSTGGSAKLTNAVKLVTAIHAQKFATLELETDGGFRVLDKKDAANEMVDHFQADPSSVWYLAETHGQSNAFTQWIRERLHRKKRLDTVEVGDLLEVYVSPDVRNAFSPGEAVPPGGRVTVASVNERSSYQQGLSSVKSGPVKFHSLRCRVDCRDEIELEVFEEFLRAEKPELDKETAVAESVWRKAAKRDRESAFGGKQAALQGIEVPPPPPAETDFTYARYGYASTVHHAQGMSQPICYVNCDHAAGRHSEGFFRWLYSALTVAERELVLLNFTDIHPFDAAVWKAGAVKVGADIAVGAGWVFQSNGIASERDQQRSLPEGLDQSKDVLKSVAIWLRVVNAVERFGWRVAKAASYPYQEQYDLSGPQGEHCLLRIAYNGKNVVTAMHVKEPEHWGLLSDVAFECLLTNDYSPEAAALLRSTRSRLGQIGWKVVSATETSYRLAITVARSQDERVVTFHHIQANWFSAHRSQSVFGTYRPFGFRHIGASRGIGRASRTRRNCRYLLNFLFRSNGWVAERSRCMNTETF
ncbi:NERD domain-containing protein [Rhodoferax sp. TBRC 17660]|uniref:NERD domain-containing protein n=1 Tax=Rhodoferax potami TaxID=3068338 RepID=A0ABU3KJ40_9BURK|nr:NERD domain-containing protein [Rhodoferax sp. TBRC 17660]MDT7517307.1 NERD domain-containing protein [Rhodoferax sp. TBRC 17660]